MWSGNAQMSGGSFPTQWALNPAAYVNMPNEQVDWASLAQQWIKMKESQPETAGTETTIDNNPQAPPPPIISAPTPAALSAQQAFYPVQEADMTSSSGAWGWGWDGGGGAGGGGWTGAGWEQSAVTVSGGDTAPYRDSMQAGISASAAQTYGSAYHESVAWSSAGDSSVPGGSGRKDWRKHRHQPQHHHHSPQPVPQPQIDAVKRKQLPAWIREGLEKMEREKLKKQQDEGGRPLDDNSSSFLVNGSPGLTAEELDVDRAAMPLSPVAAIGNRFEEDYGLDETEDSVRKSSDRSPNQAISRTSNLPPAPLPTPKSKEEIFQSVMAGVGRILTQLLMEVTNETVMQTVSQVLQRNKIKGLRIYDSDDSGSDSELDSEHHIKARIRKRQEEFSRRENEIEKEIEEQEERENRVLFGRDAHTDGGGVESSSSSESEEGKASTPPHPPPRLATPPTQPPLPSHSNHRHRSKSGSKAREKETSDGRERRRSQRHSKSRRRRHSSDSSSGSRRRRTRSRSRDRHSKHRHSSRHRHKHHRSRSLSSTSSSSGSSRHRHRRRHSHRSSRR